MTEAIGREAWNHTSSVLAMLANANRDPKKSPRAFKPSDFNPYAKRKITGMAITKENIGILKDVFVKDKQG